MSRAIPARLNLCLLLGCSLAAAGLLWAASHASSWWLRVLAALAFSYCNHTLYALLHEAVHSALHPWTRVNAWGGRLAAAFFPTTFALQKAFHLNHHRNNRGPSEQWDYLRPGDNRWLKLAQWYAILTGIYWLFIPLGGLLFLVAPGLLRSKLLSDSQVARQTAADSYGEAIRSLGTWARLEVLGTLAFQVALFVGLDLQWSGWALCYGAFAINWGSLQYADHAFSPLDVREGAWNLRTHPLVQRMLLNYPLHKAHHRHPNLSWIHLPDCVDPDEPQPGYFEQWLRMWRGPQPLPPEECS